MNKLQYHSSKSLRLVNVLKQRIAVDDENFDFNITIEQMKSYIMAKGAIQTGPLIQYTKTFIDEEGKAGMDVTLMLQCNNYIHNVEPPYSMESVIRVSNAMYCRYTGMESTLKFAYDKINIEAFEQDVSLSDCSYTIFVASDEEEDTVTADVFIPRAD